MVQGRLESSVGKGIPAPTQWPAAGDVRSGDEEDHAHRHLLWYASPDVRRRRESHAVDERRRPGGGLVESQDVRRDWRRAEVPGLDAVDHGYERQRQARR